MVLSLSRSALGLEAGRYEGLAEWCLGEARGRQRGGPVGRHEATLEFRSYVDWAVVTNGIVAQRRGDLLRRQIGQHRQELSMAEVGRLDPELTWWWHAGLWFAELVAPHRLLGQFERVEVVKMRDGGVTVIGTPLERLGSGFDGCLAYGPERVHVNLDMKLRLSTVTCEYDSGGRDVFRLLDRPSK